MKRLLPAITFLTAVAGFARPSVADPILISYVAMDLPDTRPEEDRWQYRYFVSDFTFSAGQGFSIWFDPALYADLDEPPPPVNASWDPLTFQPEPVLASAGLYDALALAGGASLADPFVVSFAWLGGPVQPPGSQFFTVNQFDSAGGLTVLESGHTVPIAQPVPEPATALLVALGTVAAAWNTRRSNRAGSRR